MRRWFKVSRPKCHVCEGVFVTFEDILRSGRCYLDGRFECADCVKNGRTLMYYLRRYGAITS